MINIYDGTRTRIRNIQASSEAGRGFFVGCLTVQFTLSLEFRIFDNIDMVYICAFESRVLHVHVDSMFGCPVS